MSKIIVSEGKTKHLKVCDCKVGDIIVIEEGSHKDEVCFVFNSLGNRSMLAISGLVDYWPEINRNNIECRYFEGTIEIRQ